MKIWLFFYENCYFYKVTNEREEINMLLFIYKKNKYKTVKSGFGGNHDGVLVKINGRQQVMCFVIWVFVRTSIILFVYSESDRLV